MFVKFYYILFPFSLIDSEGSPLFPRDLIEKQQQSVSH